MRNIEDRLFLSSQVARICWGDFEGDLLRSYITNPISPLVFPIIESIDVGIEDFGEKSFIERVLPDGLLHIYFHFGSLPEVLDQSVEGGIWTIAPQAEVIGPSLASALVRTTGLVNGIGVRFRPGAARAILGIPAWELRDVRAPLESFWGGAALTALERLRDTNAEQRVALVEQLLRERLEDAAEGQMPALPPHLLATRQAWDKIAFSSGRSNISRIAADLGISLRRLEQLFRMHIGISPKGAARLARVHASLLVAHASPERGWSWIAHDSGYTDQAHMNRDFKAICHTRPGSAKIAMSRRHFAFLQSDRAAPLYPAP